jgi:phosphohistidine phosphatase SixA
MSNFCRYPRFRSLAAPLLLALAVLFAAAPAASQPTEKRPAERSSRPSHEMTPAQLLAELRKGGYILYFRHASTDFSQNDKNMKGYEDCAHQRNLSDKGRSEAKAVGAAIRQLGIPVDRVLASPFCRTVETAQIVFGRAEKTLDLRERPTTPAKTERYAALRKIISTPVRAGANLAIVGHANPFNRIAGRPFLDEGEAAVIRPLQRDFEIVARIALEGWQPLRDAAAK